MKVFPNNSSTNYSKELPHFWSRIRPYENLNPVSCWGGWIPKAQTYARYGASAVPSAIYYHGDGVLFCHPFLPAA